MRDGSYSQFFFILLACFSLSLPASSQTVEHKEIRTLLQTKVHLRLGETTLAKTLQEMSKQTGLQIQAQDYLNDRDILVELDNMSVQDTLDTLAESNGWIWYEAKQGQIFMARPKFNKTRQLLNVAPAFRAIVPKDLRRYIGLDISDNDLRIAFRQSQPNNDSVLKRPEIFNSRSARHHLQLQLIEAPVKVQERQMFSWVTEDVKKGKKIPYAKLTSSQQHSLLVYFVFKALSTAFSPHSTGTANLIAGLDPVGVDESRMRISYKNNIIYVGILQGGKFSLGEMIMSENRLPDPLFQHTKF